MRTPSQRDLAQVEEFLRGLYRIRGVQPLIWYVLRELPTLVGTNQVTWNHVVPALHQADVMAWPDQADHDKYQSALARHVHQHPLIVNFLQTGNPSAVKLSDFLSTRQFHNTALYDELYRGLGYEDQIAINLQPLGPQWDTLVVARDKRTFRKRDRVLLNLLRPHLVQAYRRARAYARLTRMVEAQRIQPAASRIVLDEHDRIVHYPNRAARWIDRYFDSLPNAPRQLPDRIHRWLVETRTAKSGLTSKGPVPPLFVCRGGRQLIVREMDKDEGRSGRTELRLEEQTDPRTARRLLDSPLTPRELQVLLEVEKGKRNDEIGQELGVRPRTVKKHLERIFDKLGVDNRTAAVGCLRR